MASTVTGSKRAVAQIAYNSIARRIGLRLRDVYDDPEADSLPTEHVDLLLRLRHKERERDRRG